MTIFQIGILFLAGILLWLLSNLLKNRFVKTLSLVCIAFSVAQAIFLLFL